MKYIYCPYRNTSLEQAARVAIDHFVLRDGLLSSRAADLDPSLANCLLFHAVNTKDNQPVLTEQGYTVSMQMLNSLPFRDTAGWISRLPGLFCLEHTLLVQIAASLFYEVLDNDSLLAHIRLNQLPGCELLICFNADHGQNGCPGMEAAVVDLTGTQPLLRLSISAPEPSQGTVLPTARLVVDELLQAAAAASPVPNQDPDPDQPDNALQPGPGEASDPAGQPADSCQSLPDEDLGQTDETTNWW